MARAFLLAAATLACAAALAPPKTHVAPVYAGPVPAAVAKTLLIGFLAFCEVCFKSAGGEAETRQ